MEDTLISLLKLSYFQEHAPLFSLLNVYRLSNLRRVVNFSCSTIRFSANTSNSQMKYLLIIAVLASTSSAFIFDFNRGGQQQQQQQQQASYEDVVLNNACSKYLCPDTLACVSGPEECPCPFPKSQLRCTLPDGQYICISKPATHDSKLNGIYDDPIKGPKAKNKGLRDCGWVENAYKESL